MKRKCRYGIFVLLNGIISLFIAGCAAENSTIYDPNASANTSAAEYSVPETPLGNIVNEIMGPFLSHGRKAEEFNDLALFRFADTSDGSDLDSKQLPIHDGTMQADLNVLVFSAQQKTEAVSGIFVLIWNGQVYDFTLNGSPSVNGACSIECQYNTDANYAFSAENLPIEKGDNTMYLCFIPYIPQTGEYLTAQRFIGHYHAGQASTGRSPLDITEEHDLNSDRISVFTERAGADRTNDVNPAHIIRRSASSYTLHQNPSYFLNIANFADAETSDNRSGLVMFCDNGKMQAVWNDNYYASVSVAEKEYRKTLVIDTAFQAGETHNVCMIYAELTNDRHPEDELYIYSAACACTIEE